VHYSFQKSSRIKSKKRSIDYSVIFILLKKRRIIENKKEVLKRLKRMVESLNRGEK